MKKIAFVLLFILFVSVGVSAQTIYYREQATLIWDAVTVDAAGDPFLSTDTIAYEIYIYDYLQGVTNPQDVAQLILVATTSTTQQVIVFPYRTTWAAGGRTKVTDAGGNIRYSPLAWSYVATDAGANGPFLYVPLPTLRGPLNLRDSGM
jgi:hypothetical protein